MIAHCVCPTGRKAQFANTTGRFKAGSTVRKCGRWFGSWIDVRKGYPIFTAIYNAFPVPIVPGKKNGRLCEYAELGERQMEISPPSFPRSQEPTVIPAQAGTHRHSRAVRNPPSFPRRRETTVIPAQAGIHLHSRAGGNPAARGSRAGGNHGMLFPPAHQDMAMNCQC